MEQYVNAFCLGFPTFALMLFGGYKAALCLRAAIGQKKTVTAQYWGPYSTPARATVRLPDLHSTNNSFGEHSPHIGH